jgi:environmental stress-induced protein Ves
MQIVSLADRPVQRWRNGGGATSELASDSATASGGFAWRISVATITRDGPFSSFAGIDRSLVRLDGGSLALEVNDQSVSVGRHPIRFTGEDRVAGSILGEPVRVVNIMTDRTVATHQVAVGYPPPRMQNDTLFAIVLDLDANANEGWFVGDLLVEPVLTFLPDIGRFGFISIASR